jgi:carbon storage regulator CsrA
MLVLSRRLGQKIVFPAINASVQVLDIRGGGVRLGIHAPPEIAIFREEILDKPSLPRPADQETSNFRRLRHLVRNRLNAAGIGLTVLREQLKAGLIEDTEATLAKITKEFHALRQQMESGFEPAKHAPSPTARRRALLVEDDDNERELLAGLLRLAGLEVDTAGDGCDALAHLRGHAPPDVVLLDMVLPRCDGPTMLRELRRDPANSGLKVFAVSGHSPGELGLDIEHNRIDRWFQKPIDATALLSELRQEIEPA